VSQAQREQLTRLRAAGAIGARAAQQDSTNVPHPPEGSSERHPGKARTLGYFPERPPLHRASLVLQLAAENLGLAAGGRS
jgi:hypothetical protein